MTDQTVASLTDRLAAYMVEAFLDGRGYDPGDKIDVAVTLKEGFHTVLAEMREDQAAGTATYDGLLPSPPLGEEAAEARAVPEGWKVEWGGVWHPTDGEDFTLTAGYYTDRPYLVPLSPTDTPEEA